MSEREVRPVRNVYYPSSWTDEEAEAEGASALFLHKPMLTFGVRGDGSITYQFQGQERSGPNSYWVRNYSSVVPEEIVSLGNQAIRAYAQEQVEIYLAAKKEEERISTEKHNNFRHQFSLTYEDTTLVGYAAVEDHGRTLVVYLVEPLQGETGVHYGMASTMAGHHIFQTGTPELTLSRGALRQAERLLIQAFKEATEDKKNAERKKIATDLNNLDEPF